MGVRGDAIGLPPDIGIDPSITDFGQGTPSWNLTDLDPNHGATPAGRWEPPTLLQNIAEAVEQYRLYLPSEEERRELIIKAIYAAEQFLQSKQSPELIESLEKAIAEADSVRAELQGWGLPPSDGVTTAVPLAAIALANALLNQPDLLKFLEHTRGDSNKIIDALRRPFRSDHLDYGTFGPIQPTDDVEGVLQISPHAFAAFVDNRPGNETWQSVTAFQLQRGEFLGVTPRPRTVQVGGFCACVDRSGSMSAGNGAILRHEAAKAVAIAMTRAAVKEDIPFALALFASEGEDLYVFRYDPEKDTPLDAVSGVIAWASIEPGGGTSFDAPLQFMINTIGAMEFPWHAVMITDGECAISPEVVEEWEDRRTRGWRLLSLNLPTAKAGGF